MPSPDDRSAALAWLNGRFLPAVEATIPVYDAGFVLGATVSEQLRTFAGRLFRLDEHLARLARSLSIVGVEPELSCDEIGALARELVAHNAPLISPASDLGLAIFVTPGPYGTLAPAGVGGPTVGLHTYELPWSRWARQYQAGVSLVTVGAIPAAECWPAELKCRSRMHYYLADRAAAEREPGARALLSDAQGQLLETSTANLLAIIDGTLVSPPREAILPGMTLAVVEQLARDAGLGFVERPLSHGEAGAASELLLTSTPFAILPATRLDGRPVGAGRPGPVFSALLARFSALVGTDIQGQAERFADESQNKGGRGPCA